jgi:SanA protein
MYASPQTCPANDIGIVFGCGKYVAGGRTNLYYVYRIQAAADAYKAGKVKHILVSGDNHVVNYNEPENMKQDLIKAGIPEAAITLDYAGFSTFETLIRAKEVFGIHTATLITQSFHLPRALYIANALGIQAIGYAAREPYGSLRTWKTEVREILARAATFGDLHIWNRKPRFLGKKEFIVIKE